MTSIAVRAEGLAKRYRIAHPQAPSWRDYVADPRAAMKQPRTVDIEALRDVSFEVREGEVFGIIGRNGAGKSTLLKILSRITSPTAGRAMMVGRVASLLEVGTGFHPDLTGRENVLLNGMLLGMPRLEIERAFERIVEFASIGPYLDTPIKRYSSGMQLRLAFAVAAHLAADIMIVDEVLAVGDAEFQTRCTTAMRDAAGRGRTTLFVSHNMPAVESLCSRAILLERGAIVATGTAREVVHQYLAGLHRESDRAEYVSPEDDRTRALHIRRIRVHGPADGAVVQGQDLHVELELHVRERFRRVQCMIWFSTLEGSPVCAVSNADYRHEWNLEPGSYRVAVRLPDVRLLPRGYVTTVQALLDWGAERLDEVRDAVRFHVQGRDVLGTGVALLEDRGVTWMPAEYSIAPLASELPDSRGRS